MGNSITYPRHLDIDKLKIDQSFIHELPENKDDLVLVKTMIGMAKNLGMQVLAEGVESKAQMELLKKGLVCT